MTPFTLPAGYTRIKLVSSFAELAGTPFHDGVNALCWQRTLPGDFSEVVNGLTSGDGMATVDESMLTNLAVGPSGKIAARILLEDLGLLKSRGLAPMLDCIRGYPRDEDPAGVPTDVYSFHADSATEEMDTWLCTYHGPASDGLRNDEAVRRVDIPETRARLLSLYGGPDDEGFLEFLSENCYDLHYSPFPQAQPFSFGMGNLWRIATAYPDSPVPPCIHRAPETAVGHPPRLLLIS